MLTLDDATWAELAAQVRTKLDQRNARNAANGSEYTYAVKLEDCGGVDLLRTRQDTPGRTVETKVIARRRSNGEILKVRFKRVTKGRQAFQGLAAPKKWETAWLKGGIDRLINVVGLTGFIEISVSVIPNDPPATELEARESIICGHRVRIERQPGEKYYRVIILAWYWGTESHQTLTAAERAARKWCEQNPLAQAVG